MDSDSETTTFGSQDLSPEMEGGDEVDETNSIDQIRADETIRIQIDATQTLEIGGGGDETISSQAPAGDHDQPIIQQEEQLPRKRWSIFRVLDQQSDYSRPKVIPIGPSYYKNPDFQAMETQKLQFLERNGYRVPQLLAFKAEMKRLEKRARECYFEDFKGIPSDDFTWMMVLDGCFVVVLLRLNGRRYQGQLADDPIFATHTMPFNIARDLLLLASQLPLFVLEKLFRLTRSPGEEEEEDGASNSLTSLAVQFFEPLRPGKDVVSTGAANSNSDINTASNNYPHLLALFHSTLAPKNSRPSSTPPRERSNIISNHGIFGGRLFPTATNLQSIGVTFRKSFGNLMKFRRLCCGGILEVPAFFLDKHTACIFRNLVAHEQHYRSATPWFTSLAIFYNNLLQTKEDVEILKNSGILRLDMMGESDEEVLNFFASVTNELVFGVDRNCLLPLIKNITRYSQTRVASFNRGFRNRSRNRAVVRGSLGSIILLVLYRLWGNPFRSSFALPPPSPFASPHE